MTQRYRLVFDINPHAQERPRTILVAGHPRILKSRNNRSFEASVNVMARSQFKIAPLEGPLDIKLHFVLSKPKSVKRTFPTVRPDLDNYIKAICDGLNKIVYKDDCQIVQLSASKLYGTTPCIIMEVLELA